MLFGLLVADAVLFWETTFISTIIAIAIVAIGFIFFHSKEDVIFFVVASILGSVTEMIMIGSGAWQYGNPVLFGLALWTPLFWGFAYLFARRARDVIFSLGHVERHFHRHINEPRREVVVLFDASLFVTMLIFAYVFWSTSYVLLFIYAFMLFFALYTFHRPADVFFAFLAVIVGFFLEVIATQAGAWTHNNHEFFGMPMWLPIAYGLFAVIVRRAAVTANEIFSKRVFGKFFDYFK